MKKEIIDAFVAGFALYVAQILTTVVSNATGLRTCSALGLVIVGYLTVRIANTLRK